MAGKMWQLGSSGTLVYRLFDLLRMRLNRRLAGYLLSEAVPSQSATILEAGSGPAFASSILARDHRVKLSVAMDIDIEALMEARNRDPSLALVAGDLTNLPFKTESTDLTWNSSTLEHLDDPIPAFAEMARVTRTAGKLFVGVPYRYGPLGFQRWIRQTSVGIWIGTTFDLVQLKQMFLTAQATPQHHIFYFLRFFVGVLARK
jgi:SAM-dependent methyltransferase